MLETSFGYNDFAGADGIIFMRVLLWKFKTFS